MQENSFQRKGSPFLPSGPTSYVFGLGWGQQMGEEAAALCSSTHSGGAPSRTGPISPSTHPPAPWDKISEIWPQGEDKHSQGWGIKLQSAGFFLKLAFASGQTNQPVYGFPKSDVKSDTLTLSPDKISGLLP